MGRGMDPGPSLYPAPSSAMRLKATWSSLPLPRRGRAAPGLTPRSVEKFAAVQMLDVHIPTTDGRDLILTRYT